MSQPINPKSQDKQNQETKLMARINKGMKQNAATLMVMGMDTKRFADAMVEALISVENAERIEEHEFLGAIRKCCIDGLIPNGVEAAIYESHGKAVYLPMVTGLKRIIHESLPGCIIRSGYIMKSEMDDAEIIEASGMDPVIRVKRRLGYVKDDIVAASWAWLKLPGQPAILRVMNQNDIAMARSESKSGSAWGKWPGPMAEKSAVKSLMNRVRYLIPRERRALESVIANDDEYRSETVTIQATPETVKQIEAQPEEKPVMAQENVGYAEEAPQPKAVTDKAYNSRGIHENPAAQTKTQPRPAPVPAKPKAQAQRPPQPQGRPIPKQVTADQLADPTVRD